MRFACCTEEIEISGIRKCFESAMPGSVNLGLGQPDFDTPSHIKRAAIRAIEMGQCGYTPNCGVPDPARSKCAGVHWLRVELRRWGLKALEFVAFGGSRGSAGFVRIA